MRKDFGVFAMDPPPKYARVRGFWRDVVKPALFIAALVAPWAALLAFMPR